MHFDSNSSVDHKASDKMTVEAAKKAAEKDIETALASVRNRAETCANMMVKLLHGQDEVCKVRAYY